MNRKGLLLFTSILFFCSCAQVLCAASGKKVERKADSPYKDPLTGRAFPALMGSFSKTMVRISPNTVIGTRISYERKTGGGKADLYIYSLQEKPLLITRKKFEAHRKKVLADFAVQLKKDTRLSNVVKITDEDLRFTVSKTDFRSRLYLFPDGKYIVKVCLTLPAGSWEREGPLFLEQLQKLFIAGRKIIPSNKNNNKVVQNGK